MRLARPAGARHSALGTQPILHGIGGRSSQARCWAPWCAAQGPSSRWHSALGTRHHGAHGPSSRWHSALGTRHHGAHGSSSRWHVWAKPRMYASTDSVLVGRGLPGCSICLARLLYMPRPIVTYASPDCYICLARLLHMPHPIVIYASPDCFRFHQTCLCSPKPGNSSSKRCARLVAGWTVVKMNGEKEGFGCFPAAFCQHILAQYALSRKLAQVTPPSL